MYEDEHLESDYEDRYIFQEDDEDDYPIWEIEDDEPKSEDLENSDEDEVTYPESLERDNSGYTI